MPVFLKRNPLLDVTAVSNVFLLEYMPKAPEGFTKAYLLGLMQTGAPGAEVAGLDVSGVPSVSEAELARAFAYWQAAGLVRIVSDAPLTVEYLPAGASSGLAAGDAPRKYASLVAALQDVAGTRVFSGHELSEIYDWIEAFRFEEATAVLCVKDCLARCGARAKLWQMNATAKRWADAGVATPEEAERYLALEAQRSAGAQRLLRRWKRSRAATEDELALYTKWTEEWGFDESVIFDACAEMTSAAQPSFRYLDTILKTYRLNGAVTAEAAAELRRARDAADELARMLFERAGIRRTPTLAQHEQIDAWHDKWHMDAELLLYAADESRAAAQPFANIKKLVTAWYGANVATVAAAQEFERKKAASPAAQVKRTRAHNHHQRAYSDEELAKIGIDLRED